MTFHGAALRRRGATLVALTTLAAAMLMAGNSAGAAIVATVPLLTSANYAVLGHSTVTNTGPSVLNGSLGLSPGTSITGFPPGTIVPPGTTDDTNAAAAQAQADLTAAYTNAHNRPVNATTTADLGNQQLGAGVYDASSHNALQITGPLVLNGAGNASSVFIFQTDSTLTTASGSTVSLINGAQACNVFWQVGSSATLGTGSVIVGNILASASITVNSSVTVHGRALASTGAVTLDDDTFTKPSCALEAPTTTTAGGGVTTTTPGATTTVAPGAGTGAAPGGGTGTTVPGTGPITPLPGTPSGAPGVPGITGPPRTGGGPLRTSSFPWTAVLVSGVLGTAALGGVLKSRQLRTRHAASDAPAIGPSARS